MTKGNLTKGIQVDSFLSDSFIDWSCFMHLSLSESPILINEIYEQRKNSWMLTRNWKSLMTENFLMPGKWDFNRWVGWETFPVKNAGVNFTGMKKCCVLSVGLIRLGMIWRSLPERCDQIDLFLCLKHIAIYRKCHRNFMEIIPHYISVYQKISR